VLDLRGMLARTTTGTMTRTPVAPAPLVRHSIYWRETEHVDPGPPLEGDRRADVAIVGGGYTGLWTAYFLKEADPSLDIHIVEADYAGAGASGHADGFVTPTIGHSLHSVVHRFGAERSKDAYAAVGRSIMDLRRFCRKQGVDAELEPGGFYLVATNDGQRRRLEGDVELAARMGVRYDVLEGDEAQERIGSSSLTAALKSPGALVNPHRLARGLTRVVRGMGVTVHERTRALTVERIGDGHVVTTPLGRLRAPRLVLATNAYSAQWRPHRHRFRPVWSYAMVTEPLTDAQLAQVHWPDREGFVEARNFILFARLTAGNRLLIGGGRAHYHYGGDLDESHMRADDVFAELRAALVRYFPAWRDVGVSHAYGGAIAMTRDLVPHVGRGRDGAFYAYGFCGNGIAMCHTVGRSLRDLVLERDTEYTNLLFVNGSEPAFPPDPFSYLGARALTGLLDFQDRHPDVIRRQLL
jgi:glycine/D-amino acid oxidase-like deaminating enzyme